MCYYNLLRAMEFAIYMLQCCIAEFNHLDVRKRQGTHSTLEDNEERDIVSASKARLAIGGHREM